MKLVQTMGDGGTWQAKETWITFEALTVLGAVLTFYNYILSSTNF